MRLFACRLKLFFLPFSSFEVVCFVLFVCFLKKKAACENTSMLASTFLYFDLRIRLVIGSAQHAPPLIGSCS
eukprot:m.1550 g.1550  ORF g.1550 m.1550 type:complete len:72 (-) comp971_c0_seq1:59-274(-)